MAPEDVKAFTLKDFGPHQVQRCLDSGERQLANSSEGFDLVKAMHQNSSTQSFEKLSEQVNEITGATVSGIFMDIDTQTGEREIIFSLQDDLKNRFQQNMTLS